MKRRETTRRGTQMGEVRRRNGIKNGNSNKATARVDVGVEMARAGVPSPFP
jgi:hypothetical protein